MCLDQPGMRGLVGMTPKTSPPINVPAIDPSAHSERKARMLAQDGKAGQAVAPRNSQHYLREIRNGIAGTA
jgi:hypothetical protein